VRYDFWHNTEKEGVGRVSKREKKWIFNFGE